MWLVYYLDYCTNCLPGQVPIFVLRILSLQYVVQEIFDHFG